MTTPTVTWDDTLPSVTQKDPCWFVEPYTTHTRVAVVALHGREIGVYCDGEMYIRVKGINGDGWDNPSIVRYADEWRQHGIKDDKEVFERCEAGDIEWVNNAWFDLYDITNGNEHLDCVHHDLFEAVGQAEVLLSDGSQ